MTATVSLALMSDTLPWTILRYTVLAFVVTVAVCVPFGSVTVIALPLTLETVPATMRPKRRPGRTCLVLPGELDEPDELDDPVLAAGRNVNVERPLLPDTPMPIAAPAMPATTAVAMSARVRRRRRGAGAASMVSVTPYGSPNGWPSEGGLTGPGIPPGSIGSSTSM